MYIGGATFTVCSYLFIYLFILFWLTKTFVRAKMHQSSSVYSLVYLCPSSGDLFIFFSKSLLFLFLFLWCCFTSTQHDRQYDFIDFNLPVLGSEEADKIHKNKSILLYVNLHWYHLEVLTDSVLIIVSTADSCTNTAEVIMPNKHSCLNQSVFRKTEHHFNKHKYWLKYVTC